MANQRLHSLVAALRPQANRQQQPYREDALGRRSTQDLVGCRKSIRTQQWPCQTGYGQPPLMLLFVLTPASDSSCRGAERFVGTVRRECLDHLLIFGRRHLEGVMTAFLEHYHRARPHQGIDQRRPWPPPDETVALDAPVERIDRLGGLLHDYRRAA